MGLPIQKAPTYNCVLPITGTEVEFRPFLVKEQANMLVTKETEDPKAMFNALMGLLKSVTEGKLDASNIPMADLEYLFMMIRTKSVGETAKVPLPCQTETCDNVIIDDIILTDMQVDTSEMLESKIKLNDTLYIELVAPSAELVFGIEGMEEVEMIKPVLRNCLVRIYDEENVYEMADHRDSEIDEFVESLTVQQFEMITEYFASIPRLSYSHEYKCPKCGETHTQEIAGLENFF